MVNVATAYSNGRQGGQHLRSSLLQVPVLCLIIVKKSRLLNALFHNYYCCKRLVCPAVIGIISNVYCICVNYDTIFVTLYFCAPLKSSSKILLLLKYVELS